MVKRIILILLIGICLTMYLSRPSYALDNIISAAEQFATDDGEAEDAIDKGSLQETNKYLFSILFTIAVVLAAAVGMVIGIQFLFGSTQEQAKVKEILVPYVVGVFVVFSAFGIWKIVVSIGNDVAPIGISSGNSEEEQTGPVHTYRKESGYWAYCENCHRYLSENENRDRTCLTCGNRSPRLIYNRYYCANCGDELDDTERHDRVCSGCGTHIK